ncbi:hypothetical protein RCO28_23455 [Streptomyces sp. LHD-70]|uniref:hypothetical protein n=1 Tax=Streptomyces sp. LHD-70 TaxID=3072140 RepID=UPI00280F9AA8|nr:hypothetical protein [Streptomyces sp. LHD-70]MDQ8705429.1 hypothetical protein [Streptomyces sp. LHD-70]
MSTPVAEYQFARVEEGVDGGTGAEWRNRLIRSASTSVRQRSASRCSATRELPDHVREMTRDALDLASRSHWGWPQWDPTDPEGEDVRRAEVGPLTVVYTVNRPGAHLYVLAVTWAG